MSLLPTSPGLLTSGPVSRAIAKLSSVSLCQPFPVNLSHLFLCVYWSNALMHQELVEHHALSSFLHSRPNVVPGMHRLSANTWEAKEGKREGGGKSVARR